MEENKTHRERRKSISNFILIAVVAMVIVLSLSLGFLSYYEASSAMSENMSQRLTEKAENVASLIDSKIENMATLLEGTATKQRIRSGSMEERKEALTEDVERVGALRLGFADLSGNIVYNDGLSESVVDKLYFQVALSGRPAFSDPYLSEKDGRLVFNGAVPVKDQDSTVGVLIGVFDYSTLEIIINMQKFGQTGYIFLLNNKGTTIAHPERTLVEEQDNIINRAQQEPGLNQLADLHQKMLAYETGFGEYTYGGVQKVLAYTPVSYTNWFLGVAQDKSEFMGGINSILRITVIISVIFIALGIVFALYLSRRIRKPLAMMEEYAQKMAKGDLSETLSLKQDDEFGRMAYALNAAVSGFRTIIKNVKALTDKTEKATANLTEGAKQINNVASEIANVIQQVAEGANEEAKEAQEVVQATESLEQKIDEVASTTENTARKTEEMREKTMQGQTAMVELNRKYAQNLTAVKDVATAVKEVAQKSDTIRAILDTISSISNQTNLLALNAAIEAARAGEYGKGFAVVADEIRNLAESSNAATQDIAGIVDEITTVIRTAEKSMDNAREITEEMNASIEDTSSLFKGMEEEMDEVYRNMEKLVSNVEAMNEEREKVLKSIESVSAVIEESASATEEVSASVEEQTASIEKITALVEELDNMVRKLKGTINIFNIGS